MTSDARIERLPAQAALGHQLFTAAWMAVALGFVLETLVALGAFTLAGGTTAQAFLANVGHKVTWGTLVCVGLAFARAFKPGDTGTAAWMGILGAPTAFVVARSAHKGLASALGLGASAAAPMLLVLLATIKSLEYGVLGAWLSRLDERSAASAGTYVRSGAVVGVLFGGAALACMWLFSPASPSAADWFARGVNEVLFPVGCSLILFLASSAGKRLQGT